MSRSRSVSRREFLQIAGVVAGGVAGMALLNRTGGAVTQAANFSVDVTSSPGDPIASSAPGQWAIQHLREALIARGVAIGPPADLTIAILRPAGDFDEPLAHERRSPEGVFFSPSPDRKTLFVGSADPIGLVYSLTELADRVRLAADVRATLTSTTYYSEKPVNGHRGIFRMFTSENEDKKWFYDHEGWKKYIDMLVTQRFNRFNLSFGLSYDFSNGLTDTYTFFLYPFFVDVPGYKVRAIANGSAPLPEEERKKNLDTLKFISDEAALRGLKFTLGIWTHNYRWTSSPNATYTIDGLDAQSQAPYSRDAMKMILGACPGIAGITLRTHGESGVPEGSYDLWKIIMAGITGHRNADGTQRIIELDLHGKTMTQEMIDTAATTGMPLVISCKHWAEHMGLPYVQASIRESEMPKTDARGLMALSSGSRNFLRYGIGDLLRKGRNYKIIHRVWPGTQHVLLWGDPVYAAGYGRMGGVLGTDGIDFFEPLSFRGRGGSSVNKAPEPDRTGYADDSLRPKYEWEKYLYTFRLWGRLAYNPDAEPETLQRQLRSDFDVAYASRIETALASASRILPLITTAHLPAAASDSYWPEMYTHQSLHNPGGSPYSETPSPRVFGNVSPLDPQIFATVNQYVDALLSNTPDARISPLEVARQLDIWSAAAMRALEESPMISRLRDTAVRPRRAGIDITIAAGLGQFFAHKFRAAVLWQLFNVSGHEPARAAAVDAYKDARDAWAKLADTAKVYVPNLNYGSNRNLRGHWADRLPALDADIAGLAAAAPQPRTPAPAPATIDKLIESVLHPVAVVEDAIRVAPPGHLPPASFKPKEPLALEIRWAGGTSALLWYRHVHQGQRYSSLDMRKQGITFAAAIPADYTDSPFPLQYYFELRSDKSAQMFPGFKPDFTGTPYFVVPPA